MNKALKEAIKNMLSPEQIAIAGKIKSALWRVLSLNMMAIKPKNSLSAS